MILSAALIILLGLSAYGFFIEPYQVAISHVWIRDEALSTILRNRVLVQISDLHVSRIGLREQKILNIVDQLRPDFIFLTGDYVAWKGDYAAALTFLSRLEAKIGVWAVMGDYDYSKSRESCLFCHDKDSGNFTRRHRIHFLRNNCEKIILDEGVFWIGGKDSEEHHETPYLTELTSQQKKIPVIVLSHIPLLFEQLSDKMDVLILAGDTHGGQVHLPGWLWKIMGYRKNALYNYGFFKRGQKKMFVSRGVGTSHIPLRVCAPPEVVVLHFY